MTDFRQSTSITDAQGNVVPARVVDYCGQSGLFLVEVEGGHFVHKDDGSDLQVNHRERWSFFRDGTSNIGLKLNPPKERAEADLQAARDIAAQVCSEDNFLEEWCEGVLSGKLDNHCAVVIAQRGIAYGREQAQ